MVIYIIIAIIIIVFLKGRKEGYFNGYYFITGENNFITGDNECIYKDGIVSCKEGLFPTQFKRPGYRYCIIDE